MVSLIFLLLSKKKIFVHFIFAYKFAGNKKSSLLNDNLILATEPQLQLKETQFDCLKPHRFE